MASSLAVLDSLETELTNEWEAADAIEPTDILSELQEVSTIGDADIDDVLRNDEVSSQTKSLPRETQLQLLSQARAGNQESAETLIEAVYAFIHYMNKYCGSVLSQEEAEEIGYFGIAKALDSFDCERGVLFTTHACNHIRWAMLNEIKRRSKVSENETQSEDIARWAGESKQGSEHEVVDPLECDVLLEKRKLVSFLDPKEQEIILCRSGGLNGTVYTQQQTAERIGVSKARVGQIESVAKQTIQSVIDNDGVLPISAVVNRIEREHPRSATVLRGMHGINKHRETHSVKEMMTRYEMSQSGVTTMRAAAKSEILFASGIIGMDHPLKKAVDMLKKKDAHKQERSALLSSLGEITREKVVRAISQLSNPEHQKVLALRFGETPSDPIAMQGDVARELGCTESNVQMAELLALPRFCTRYLLDDPSTSSNQQVYVTLLELLNTTKDNKIRGAVLRILDSTVLGRMSTAFGQMPSGLQENLTASMNPEHEEQSKKSVDRNTMRKISYERKVGLLDALDQLAEQMDIPIYQNPIAQKMYEHNTTSVALSGIADEQEVEEIENVIATMNSKEDRVGKFLKLRYGLNAERKMSYREIHEQMNLPLVTIQTMFGDALRLLDKKLSFSRRATA